MHEYGLGFGATSHGSRDVRMKTEEPLAAPLFVRFIKSHDAVT